MKVGIIGLPQSGKKSLFRLLAGDEALARHHDPFKPVAAVAEMPDPRFDKLVSIYSPARSVRSRLELTLFPSLSREGAGVDDMERGLAEMEAFCYVVRAFEDRSVYHPEGSIDPGRDIESLESELVLHDLLFVEKRIERIEGQIQKAKDDLLEREKKLLLRMKESLEEELPLRLMDLDKREMEMVSSYPLLSRKGVVVVVNVSDEQLGSAGLLDDLGEKCSRCGMGIVPLAVKTEVEISLLESPEEQEEFMKAMGIESRALHALSAMLIATLDLVSFFTVRNNEVRQWLLKRGSTALEAAGAIHTDMARGFIRAEVMKYEDLVRLGGEEPVKAEGKLQLKGKDYLVEDGDILSIRFNV